MMYKEMTIEEAMKRCKKNTKVLVAIQDMEKNDDELSFIVKKRDDYDKLFEDVKTVAATMDDLVNELRCFTRKQNIYDIQPIGVQKIVLLDRRLE